MKIKEYLCGEKIKENSSLVALLQECENDFDITPTFSNIPMAMICDEVKEEAYKNHVPMTVYEHEVGIPLKPKALSSFGVPKHPDVGDYVEYCIAPTQGNQNIAEWALYEIMWRKFESQEG